MRHVYIRSIIGVILAGAAIMGGGPICIILLRILRSGNICPMSAGRMAERCRM